MAQVKDSKVKYPLPLLNVAVAVEIPMRDGGHGLRERARPTQTGAAASWAGTTRANGRGGAAEQGGRERTQPTRTGSAASATQPARLVGRRRCERNPAARNPVNGDAASSVSTDGGAPSAARRTAMRRARSGRPTRATERPRQTAAQRSWRKAEARARARERAGRTRAGGKSEAGASRCSGTICAAAAAHSIRMEAARNQSCLTNGVLVVSCAFRCERRLGFVSLFCSLSSLILLSQHQNAELLK